MKKNQLHGSSSCSYMPATKIKLNLAIIWINLRVYIKLTKTVTIFKKRLENPLITALGTYLKGLDLKYDNSFVAFRYTLNVTSHIVSEKCITVFKDNCHDEVN